MGIIPAGAGLTVQLVVGIQFYRDHPRGCGAHARFMNVLMLVLGSSPRVRGSLFFGGSVPYERGIIPACARDTCRVAGSPACRGDHLRMCGEHGAVVVELDCSKIPRDQLSRLEHQSGGYLRAFYFSWI